MVERYYQEPRKRMRLEGYDYSLEGYYFVTICTDKRIHYLVHDIVARMVRRIWYSLHEKNSGVYLDEFIVMPNHIHGIIQIVGADLCVGPSKKSISRVIQIFKAITTNDYLKGVNEKDWPPLFGKLWQRGFYDRIIRSEEELNILRKYIRDNPKNWEHDEENQEGPIQRSAPTIR